MLGGLARFLKAAAFGGAVLVSSALRSASFASRANLLVLPPLPRPFFKYAEHATPPPAKVSLGAHQQHSHMAAAATSRPNEPPVCVRDVALWPLKALVPVPSGCANVWPPGRTFNVSAVVSNAEPVSLRATAFTVILYVSFAVYDMFAEVQGAHVLDMPTSRLLDALAVSCGGSQSAGDGKRCAHRSQPYQQRTCRNAAVLMMHGVMIERKVVSAKTQGDDG